MEDMASTILMIAGGVIAALVLFKLTYWLLSLRRVVPTNEVHVVQSSKRTTSYGKDTTDKMGNTYYAWPSWIPVIGISVTTFPVSVFDLDLINYEAYDKGRLPFVVDIKAFFRIENTNMAAARVEDFDDLRKQLMGIVQGSVRTIMANAELEDIMSQRSTYGEQFTQQVEEQLKSWGLIPVKNIELMDIRDSKDGAVIRNIMEKKKSQIEMESRTVVAENMRKAETAEIEAQREVNIQAQQAEQAVGLRTAEKDRAVGIANEQAAQEVKEQERVTKEKEMAIHQVAVVRQAEITKEQQVVAAQQDKETTILVAEGQLEAKKREAEGIQVEGAAKAEAEKAMQLAPVEAQIVLAKEIGTNEGYQTYLVKIEQVSAAKVVGVAQAAALEKADLKVIANTGEPVAGVTNLMELFTPKGGTSIGGMMEALAQSPMGAAVLKSLTDNAANDTPATGKITPPVASEHSDAPKPHKTKSA